VKKQSGLYKASAAKWAGHLPQSSSLAKFRKTMPTIQMLALSWSLTLAMHKKKKPKQLISLGDWL